jgi:hypothetical protein
MDWFNGEILPPDPDPLTCSSALVLYPGGIGTPNPRNRYGSAPGVPFGFSNGRISVFAEIPDGVFPLGQIGTRSNITNHTEFLPVAIDVMAAKGCDGLLVKLAQDLVAEGVLAVPLAGQTILGGDILMKRRAEELGMEEVRYVG